MQILNVIYLVGVLMTLALILIALLFVVVEMSKDAKVLKKSDAGEALKAREFGTGSQSPLEQSK